MVFSHPRNPTAPTDLTATYEWSPDLSNWYLGNGIGGPPSGIMERVFLRLSIR